MPITIPTSEPPVLTAGETALWQRDLSPDFPAPTWSLNYILTGPARIYLNSSANGAHHEINVAAATTANYVPGHYAVTARVSDGTSVFAVAVANPILQVRLNPADQDVPLVTDPRSYAARTLEHLIKVAAGGRHTLENCRLACRACNNGHRRPPLTSAPE